MIKVIIVDDSAVVRAFLKEVLSKDPSIEVVGTAPDPYVARDKILKYNPDVITLDVEMPRMDGITFLKKLMRHYPVPVLILSSLTQKGAVTTLEAMEEGAVDVIAKPSIDVIKGMEAISSEILRKVKAAASARVKKLEESTHPGVLSRPEGASRALTKTTHRVVAIGASTGGTEAIKNILKRLPRSTPGMVIVQHMPEKFTSAFAKRLDDLSEMEVREASPGDSVIPGIALLAPGNHHMRLNRDGARYCVSLDTGPPVFHQRPSVDVLFDSVAEYAGANATGVLLTGMGSDGATGLLKMKKAGAWTIAQDEESSVVYGMPREAARLGAARTIAPLESIAEAILDSDLNKDAG